MNPAAQEAISQIAPQPTSGVELQPNHFELKHRDVSVTFDTTSLTGEPILHYHDNKRDVTARGDQIRQVQTEIGTAVTITLKLLGIDTGADVFTLFIPRVHLAGRDEPIATLGIYTHNNFGLLPVPGQLQSYQTLELQGVARLVYS